LIGGVVFSVLVLQSRHDLEVCEKFALEENGNQINNTAQLDTKQ
jgi:hypothetical protein